jgi:hypothetical protein
MEILSAMLADAADAYNGKLYIHGGGWDNIAVRQFPATHPFMSLVLLLCADASEAPGQGELRIQLVDDDAADTGIGAAGLIGIGHGPLYKAGHGSLVPVTLPFAGVKFEKPGQYEFRIFWNGEKLNSAVTFSVSKPPSLPTPGPAPAEAGE